MTDSMPVWLLSTLLRVNCFLLVLTMGGLLHRRDLHVAFLLQYLQLTLPLLLPLLLLLLPLPLLGLLKLPLRWLAGTTTDDVDCFKLIILEKVGGGAGQCLWGVVGVLHLAGRDASGQQSESVLHVDGLQLGGVGLRGCDGRLAGLHYLGPDKVSEAGQEFLVFKEAESVLDAYCLDLDLLGGVGSGGVGRSKPDSLSVVRVGTL